MTSKIIENLKTEISQVEEELGELVETAEKYEKETRKARKEVDDLLFIIASRDREIKYLKEDNSYLKKRNDRLFNKLIYGNKN